MIIQDHGSAGFRAEARAPSPTTPGGPAHNLAEMFDAPALRDLRRVTLIRANCYRRSYLREGFGLDHRMWANMLQQAREYRAAEKLRLAQSDRKAA